MYPNLDPFFPVQIWNPHKNLMDPKHCLESSNNYINWFRLLRHLFIGNCQLNLDILVSRKKNRILPCRPQYQDLFNQVYTRVLNTSDQVVKMIIMNSIYQSVMTSWPHYWGTDNYSSQTILQTFYKLFQG